MKLCFPPAGPRGSGERALGNVDPGEEQQLEGDELASARRADGRKKHQACNTDRSSKLGSGPNEARRVRRESLQPGFYVAASSKKKVTWDHPLVEHSYFFEHRGGGRVSEQEKSLAWQSRVSVVVARGVANEILPTGHAELSSRLLNTSEHSSFRTRRPLSRGSRISSQFHVDYGLAGFCIDRDALRCSKILADRAGACIRAPPEGCGTRGEYDPRTSSSQDQGSCDDETR